MTIAQASIRQRREPVFGLDIVRFLAAMLVVSYHLGFKAWAIEGSTLNGVLGTSMADPPGWQVSWCGWVGVQVFFVVSGAVIAYSTQGASARGFAERRVARLLPALLITVGIALPISIMVFSTSAGKAVWLALKTITFMPWGPWIIGQFWTIPIELGFYALVCALLASGRLRQGMECLAWALGAVCTGYWLAVTFGWLGAGGRLTELLLVQHGAYFALGILCARFGSGDLAPRHLILALSCVMAAAMQIRIAAAWEMAGRAELADRWPLAYAIWLGLTIIVALSFRYRDAVARLLQPVAGALRLAGLSTYPLYLVHFHVGGAVLLIAHPFGFVPAFLCASGASLLVSLAIAAWLEPPLHSLVRAGIGRIGRLALALPHMRIG